MNIILTPLTTHSVFIGFHTWNTLKVTIELKLDETAGSHSSSSTPVPTTNQHLGGVPPEAERSSEIQRQKQLYVSVVQDGLHKPDITDVS